MFLCVNLVSRYCKKYNYAYSNFQNTCIQLFYFYSYYEHKFIADFQSKVIFWEKYRLKNYEVRNEITLKYINKWAFNEFKKK